MGMSVAPSGGAMAAPATTPPTPGTTDAPTAPTASGGGGTGCCCACMQAVDGQAALGGGAAASPAPIEAAAPDPAPAPAPAPPVAAGSAPSGFKIHDPLPGATVTSHFGEIADIRGGRPHTGTDLARGQGTPIHAAAPGTVKEVGYSESGLGNYVVIDHGNGWTTTYGHMVERPSVNEGDKIDADQEIGKVGSTGNSTGPHLHFMVAKNGENLDAEPFLRGERTLD